VCVITHDPQVPTSTSRCTCIWLGQSTIPWNM